MASRLARGCHISIPASRVCSLAPKQVPPHSVGAGTAPAGSPEVFGLSAWSSPTRLLGCGALQTGSVPHQEALARGPAPPPGAPGSALDGGTLISTGACPRVLDAARGLCLGMSERRSGARPVDKQRLHSCQRSASARRGGQDSSGHHVAFWEASPSTWPGGRREELP